MERANAKREISSSAAPKKTTITSSANTSLKRELWSCRESSRKEQHSKQCGDPQSKKSEEVYSSSKR